MKALINLNLVLFFSEVTLHTAYVHGSQDVLWSSYLQKQSS